MRWIAAGAVIIMMASWRLAYAVAIAALAAPAATSWCQVENVKADVHGNHTYAGQWRIDGCTTLTLDHGYCSEEDCPWRIKFGDEDIIELAHQLHGNTGLTALSIAANKITDESAIAIAESLKDHQAITDLNLHANQIGDPGALALADSLANNEILLTINIGANQLTDEGALALLSVLKSNVSALETLNVAGNMQVSEAVIRNIENENRMAFTPPADVKVDLQAPALSDGSRDEL